MAFWWCFERTGESSPTLTTTIYAYAYMAGVFLRCKLNIYGEPMPNFQFQFHTNLLKINKLFQGSYSSRKTWGWRMGWRKGWRMSSLSSLPLLPSLKGGAGGTGDMIQKAIRSGWRHGVILENGRHVAMVGNCSFEVSHYLILMTLRISFRQQFLISKIEKRSKKRSILIYPLQGNNG